MEALTAAIRAAGIDAPLHPAHDADAISGAKGSYLLAILIAEPLDVTPGRAGPVRLDPGWFIYCGSAAGPGGLRARLRRHFRSDKKPHWHVDRLTVAAAEMAAFALAGGNECELVASLLADPHFETAVPGFGNTDCRRCESHLLRFRG